ncbi:hypothetical protein ACJIZ3_017990 [Penstemon smallii]|uniref:Uncharacterized protein n=1 Tax=Penstemon smallii TaxID=265156 RepID=A0ABD3SYD9_9LAMI
MISNYFVHELRLEMLNSLLFNYELGLRLRTFEIPNLTPVISRPIEPKLIFHVILFNYKSSFTKCTSKIFFLTTLDT